MKSYLSVRRQRVRVGNTVSDCLVVSTGVPQGSILGPLLYIIYVSDMEEALKQLSAILLFADDTNTLSKGKTTKESLEKAQETMQVVQDWFRGNKIKTNGAKGKYIVFNPISEEPEERKLLLEGSELLEVGENKKEKLQVFLFFLFLSSPK